eukprot:2031655-Rhodomonas_salina.1
MVRHRKRGLLPPQDHSPPPRTPPLRPDVTSICHVTCTGAVVCLAVLRWARLLRCAVLRWARLLRCAVLRLARLLRCAVLKWARLLRCAVLKWARLHGGLQWAVLKWARLHRERLSCYGARYYGARY